MWAPTRPSAFRGVLQCARQDGMPSCDRVGRNDLIRGPNGASHPTLQTTKHRWWHSLELVQRYPIRQGV